MKMNLSQRERKILIAAGVVFALLLVYLGLDSLLRGYDELDRDIAKQERDLVTLGRLSAQYQDTRRQLTQIKAKLDQTQKGFSVLSFIEDLANKENIRENIGSMKPKKLPVNEQYEETLVEIQMDNVTLPKLIDFIFKIENSGHLLKVKRLRIKTRYDNRDLLYVTLQVSTYRNKA